MPDRWTKEILSQEWLTAKQVAARLNVSVDTIYDRISERRLTSRREGRALRVEAASLASYIHSTTTPARAALTTVSTKQQERAARTGDDAYDALWGPRTRGKRRAAR